MGRVACRGHVVVGGYAHCLLNISIYILTILLACEIPLLFTPCVPRADHLLYWSVMRVCRVWRPWFVVAGAGRRCT